MKIDLEIKERIYVELETFKSLVIVIIALSGGVSLLLINLYYEPVNKMLSVLFSTGSFFLIGFTIFAITRYLAIRKLLKRLKINKK